MLVVKFSRFMFLKADFWMRDFRPVYNENFYVPAQLFHPLLQQYSGPGMRNQTVQNVAVAQAGKLWCNHPKLLNHQAVHGCLMMIEQTLPDIPII